MDVFGDIELLDITDQTENLLVENMTERKMIIETRPSYPANKLTFTIADFTKDKVIKFFNIYFDLNEQYQYDVGVVMEDSKRNFMNSFESYNSSFYKLKQTGVHTEMFQLSSQS